MRKIKLLLSYDGAGFEGWQRQPDKPTVQGVLEEALSRIYNQPVKTVGSGRTDAGTHAVGQVAHFEAPKVMKQEERLVRALNSMLPESVVVKDAWLAPEDFHALYSARRKTYIYRIWNHPLRSALWAGRALWVPQTLDLAVLSSLGAAVVGEHDFKSFQTSGTPVKSTVRTISAAEWKAVSGGHLVEFRISGSGFLKQMVRNLVGTLLHLERNGGGVNDLKAIFDARDRQSAKTTVAAHGLYLYRVEYPSALDKKCRKL